MWEMGCAWKRCMLKIAALGKTEYPMGSDVLVNTRYVNDLLESSSEIKPINQKRIETTELLGTFGFQVKNWKSNNSHQKKIKQRSKLL